MTKDDYDPSQIRRNPDGSFMKGFSANPGAKLSKGQKIVREFAIANLEDILKRLKRIYEDEETSIELRVNIFFKLIERAAGKVEEAPIRDDDDDNQIAKMTGQKIMDALKWAMEHAGEQGKDDGKG